MRGRFTFACVCTLMLCAVVTGSAGANDADRTYIRQKLSFFYVPSPNTQGTTIPVAQAVNVDDVVAGRGTGDFYTSATFAKHRNVIKALMSAGPVSGSGNLDTLQRVVASTLRIRNLPVAAYIINDETTQVNKTNNSTLDQYGICTSSTRSNGERVWPCAIANGDSREQMQWAGSMSLPTWAFNHNSQFRRLRSVLAAFCHENMHTQDISDGRSYLYGIYSYGADQTHYWAEAIPNMSYTYSEGIANFAAYWYDNSAATRVVNWFTNNGQIVVEVSRPAGINADIWLYNIITSGSNAPRPVRTANGYAYFNIRSLPAAAIAHNENIIAIMLYNQARYTSFDGVMGCVKSVNPSMYRTCGSAFANLIESLCRAGLPSGRTVEELTQQTFNEPQTYLLPLAVCDYFTSFRSQNQTQFAQVFENMLNNSWIQAYWPQRDNIMRSVNRDRPAANDMANIAQALQIRASH